MVRIHPDPPSDTRHGSNGFQGFIVRAHGAIAQLGERLLCKQEVTGSIPVGSTRFCDQDAARSASREGRVSQCILFFGCSLTIRKKQGGSGPFFRAGLTG